MLVKVAAKWQPLTVLVQKSKGENKSQIATSPDILVAKEKNLVANATVLVAILSPVTKG